MKNILLMFMLAVTMLACKNEGGSSSKTVLTDDQARTMSLDDALAIAQKEDKNVMLFYTGSDWCKPCKLMKEKIFSTPEFKKYEKENLLKLVIDKPIKTKLPQAEIDRNKAIESRISSAGSVPRTVLLNAKGGKILDKKGFLPNWDAKSFITILEEAGTTENK